MIGVFDSGRGAEFALAHLRRLKPNADVAVLKDCENAPYGTKSKEQIICLVKRNIERLLSFGVDKVLMACCTASTVYNSIPREYREVSIPIVSATARWATKISKEGKIGVISTEATRRSRAFPLAILDERRDAEVISVSAGELVALAEGGATDGSLDEKAKSIINRAVNPFLKSNIDTLILGCTHFAFFEREIRNILGVQTVNSAKVGAEEIAAFVTESGEGRTFYL